MKNACCYLILVVLSVQACISLANQVESEDDFFRLAEGSNGAGSRKPAVINPKKSVLPIGPPVTPVYWNETSFAYFGGWGQLISTDVHHFYIDTEAILSSLDASQQRKPIFLQLRQKLSDRVHIELFMSNGEYPTPGKHKFSCNTKDMSSVTIKLPPITQNSHWLIRVQPSEPMSVWSKSLEYSLRLYERETTADTFSETWEGFFATFLLVLATTVGIVFYIRSIKQKEAKRQAEDEKRNSVVFHNLNSDQQLLSLTEAREQAKQGQLEQTHSLNLPGRTHSVTDINRVVDAIIRRASPDTHHQSVQSSPSNLQPSAASPSSTLNAPNKTTTPARSQVFTRASPLANEGETTSNPATQSENTINANTTQKTPTKSLNPSTPAAAPAPAEKPASTSKPTNNANPPASTSSQASTTSSSNVKKMTAFWANNAK